MVAGHSIIFSYTVLGIDPRNQADPREWFVTLVGEKCTQWQMFVTITFEQTSKHCSQLIAVPYEKFVIYS